MSFSQIFGPQGPGIALPYSQNVNPIKPANITMPGMAMRMLTSNDMEKSAHYRPHSGYNGVASRHQRMNPQAYNALSQQIGGPSVPIVPMENEMERTTKDLKNEIADIPTRKEKAISKAVGVLKGKKVKNKDIHALFKGLEE